MATRSTWLTGLAAAAVVLGLSVPANAQDVMEGRTAFDNLRATGGRSPGRMVTAGLARAQATAAGGRAQVAAPQITETLRPTPIRAQFLADVIEILFEQLEQTFLFLGSRWLARAGLGPLLPADLFFPPPDGSGSDLSDLLDQIGGDPGSTGSDSDDSDSTNPDGGGKPGGR